MRTNKQLSLLVLAMLPLAAAADGKAVIHTGDAGDASVMEISWQDTGTLRMESRGDPTYFIMRDGKAYAITEQGGETRVIDIGAMMEMMRGAAGSEEQAPTFGEIGSVEATGATETVAGIEGRVYRMQWTDHEGKQQTSESVLTDDPLAVELTDVYLNGVSSMFGNETTGFEEGLPADDRGLLRGGEHFRIQSISDETPPASTFELPAEPMDLQQMMQGG